MATRSFNSFKSFGTHLFALASEEHDVGAHLLAVIADHIEKDAKARFGEYQSGWHALSDRTLEDKERLGYAPPDNPLLRTGATRDSISHVLIYPEAVIGSPSMVMLYHELGTRLMTPRPVIGPAVQASRVFIENQVGVTLLAWLAGDGWKRQRAVP